MSATVRVTVQPAQSSRGMVPTTIPMPADAAGQRSAPRAASSGTFSSTKAMIQASSPNASDFFNSLLVKRPWIWVVAEPIILRGNHRVAN